MWIGKHLTLATYRPRFTTRQSSGILATLPPILRTDPTETTEADRDQLIDEMSEDQVLRTGFDTERGSHASTVIRTFKQFIKQNCDELPALQILCNRPVSHGVVTEGTLNELEEALKRTSNLLTRESLWFAYQQVFPAKVRGSVEQQTDIISLHPICYWRECFSGSVQGKRQQPLY